MWAEGARTQGGNKISGLSNRVSGGATGWGGKRGRFGQLLGLGSPCWVDGGECLVLDIQHGRTSRPWGFFGRRGEVSAY